MPANLGWVTLFLLIGVTLMGVGCSSSAPNGQSDAQSSSADDRGTDATSVPPTVSIADRDDADDEEELDDDEQSHRSEPAEGTPEWHIREILRIRLMPFPSAAKNSDGNSEGDREESDRTARIRRERNLKVIELAKQAIALSHKNPEKEVAFNAAVNHLLDAHLQLALAGEQEDVDALYEVAEALQNSKPNSEAAASAALTVVNFAHANAVRYGEAEPRWIQEFAHQAQLFAARISESLAALGNPESEDKSTASRRLQLQSDASRAAQILMAAGQSCDAAGLTEEAKTCYLLIRSKFPDSVPAQQVAGILRRLHLKGQPLQLAGPTLDGNFVSIEDFKGKTVLVVFWSSQAKPFLDQLPALTELLKKAQKHVSVIGVCLDTDEAELDRFLEEQGLSWPQIFYSEPDKRGWNSPLASYYGITSLPTMWIVDASGVVAETEVAAADLEPKLRDIVRKGLPAKKSAGAGRVQPTGGTSGAE